MITQERDLPRGCSLVGEPDNLGLLEKLDFLARQARLIAWEREWFEREQNIRMIFVQLVGALTTEEEMAAVPRQLLSSVDEETGLRNRELLRAGVREMNQGSLVVVTNNRIGMDLEGERGVVVLGGLYRFNLMVGIGRHRERRAGGVFTGVVLNAEHELAQTGVLNKEDPKFLTYLIETWWAVTRAFKASVYADQEGLSEHYLSQGEVDRALNWAITGR
jgi:hypothetical protein